MRQTHRKIQRTKRRKSTFKPRGALGAGTAYVMLVLLVIMAAGALMIGNIFPNVSGVTNGQSVIITTNTPEPKKSNLQLYTFPGATYTPTPSPTTPPQPQDKFPAGKGSGGGSTCFVAGTKILMADGTEKNIENVSVGNKVTGYDTSHKKLVAESVLALEAPIRDHHYDVTLADGTKIGLTREHPLYTSGGWESINPVSTLAENPNLKVGQLHIGDRVLKSNGSYAAIVSMPYYPGNVQTYNLKQVTGFNDFFANGGLAHNKGGSGGSTSTAR